MYDNILIATDGSEHAATALEHALEAANRYGATLHALYVIETRTEYDNAILNPDELREYLREDGKEVLEEVDQRADEHDMDVVTTIAEGIPPNEILAYIDEKDIDYVFMGEHGHSQFKTVLLGSTTEGVLHETAVPVAIV